MASMHLRENFNAVGLPRYSCAKATLAYTRHDGVEMQILTFYGTGADGVAFTEKSAPLSAGVDVNSAARAVAQTMLDRKEALS